jgi:hypothetical protein
MKPLHVDQAFPYEFVIEPREYQLYEFFLNAEKPKGHLFWAMRSGKSKVCIDCISHLWFKELVDTVIIFTRKGLHSDWITQHFPIHCSIDWKGFIWDSTKRKTKTYPQKFQSTLSHPGLKVFAFNNHSIAIPQAQKYLRHLLRRKTFLIADESSDFGRIGSKITRLMIGLGNKVDYARILSGSHIGNSPLRLFTQFQILEKGCLGFKTYTDFKNHHAVTTMEQTKEGYLYEVIESYQNLPELMSKVEKFGTVLTKKDIPGLPQTIKTVITIVPSEEQKRVYRRISNEVRTELLSGFQIDKFSIAVRLQKLQQILSNFIKEDNEFSVIDPNSNPRLETLFHQIQIENEKNIVWCRFRYEVEMIYQECKARKIPVVQVHGNVPMNERDSRIAEFRNFPGIGVFVATAKSVGLGKNLSGAKTIYWFSKTFDAVDEQQAEERATVIGSESIGVVSLQVPYSIDTYIQKVLDEKAEHYETMKGKRWQEKFLQEFESMQLEL